MKTVCVKHQQAYEVAQGCPYCPSISRTVLTPTVLKSHLAVAKARGFCVGRVWTNPKDFAHLREVGQGVLELEGQSFLLKLGLFGYVEDSSIWISRFVPEGYIYLVEVNDGSPLNHLMVPPTYEIIQL